MSKELVVCATRHETRVAVLEDDQLVEIYFQREKEYSLAGSIHKGRVTRGLPGMQSAFVGIGLDREGGVREAAGYPSPSFIRRERIRSPSPLRRLNPKITKKSSRCSPVSRWPSMAPSVQNPAAAVRGRSDPVNLPKTKGRRRG